jgi:uncharacterized membrane protein
MGNDSDSTAVYNILAFTFQGEDVAAQNLKDVKSSGALDGYDIVAQATVSQDEKGKVHVKEPGKGGKGAVIGGAIGGALGLFGGPAGVLALGAAGAAIGGVAGHLDRYIPKDDLEELGDALTPDSSALLLLLEDTYSEGVINDMSGYNANVVTLTVGDDLSGQIAQYTAGAATDDQGDVVAGESAVAADDAGDVAAASDVVAGSTDDDDAAASDSS